MMFLLFQSQKIQCYGDYAKAYTLISASSGMALHGCHNIELLGEYDGRGGLNVLDTLSSQLTIPILSATSSIFPNCLYKSNEITR